MMMMMMMMMMASYNENLCRTNSLTLAKLQSHCITSLEERRLRGDIIEVYKLLTGKEHIDHRQFFNSANTPYGLRGHEKKLAMDRSRLDSINTSLVKEWSMDGTVFRQKSSTQNQLTASRTPTTATTAKIRTTEADQLTVHQPTSTSKIQVRAKSRKFSPTPKWRFTYLFSESHTHAR